MIDAGATRIELEVGGERVVVEGWTAGASPPTEIVVNGERFPLQLTVEDRGSPVPRPPPSSPALGAASATRTAQAPGAGASVAPPMPGRVVELRVVEGDRVQKGQVLLVLEAMKMRNEILSPADGVVRRLSVAAGANVRAHEAMLWVEPA